jgi:hypothetical protein
MHTPDSAAKSLHIDRRTGERVRVRSCAVSAAQALCTGEMQWDTPLETESHNNKKNIFHMVRVVRTRHAYT